MRIGLAAAIELEVGEVEDAPAKLADDDEALHALADARRPKVDQADFATPKAVRRSTRRHISSTVRRPPAPGQGRSSRSRGATDRTGLSSQGASDLS